MYFKAREEEVILLKKLWTGEKVPCPKCGKEFLEHLHKKAKKSDTEWKCPECGEIFRTINMLNELPEIAPFLLTKPPQKSKIYQVMSP